MRNVHSDTDLPHEAFGTGVKIWSTTRLLVNFVKGVNMCHFRLVKSMENNYSHCQPHPKLMVFAFSSYFSCLKIERFVQNWWSAFSVFIAGSLSLYKLTTNKLPPPLLWLFAPQFSALYFERIADYWPLK